MQKKTNPTEGRPWKFDWDKDVKCQTVSQKRQGPVIREIEVVNTIKREIEMVTVVHASGLQVAVEDDGEQNSPIVSVAMLLGDHGLYLAYGADTAEELGHGLIKAAHELRKIEQENRERGDQ